MLLKFGKKTSFNNLFVSLSLSSCWETKLIYLINYKNSLLPGLDTPPIKIILGTNFYFYSGDKVFRWRYLLITYSNNRICLALWLIRFRQPSNNVFFKSKFDMKSWSFLSLRINWISLFLFRYLISINLLKKDD